MTRKKRRKLRFLSFLLLLFSGIFVESKFLAPNRFKVRVEVVKDPSIPASFNNTTVAYFSDIYHNKKNFEKNIKSIQEYAPDLILFGGNISANLLSEEDRIFYQEALQDIKAPLGKYYILSDLDLTLNNQDILTNADFRPLNSTGSNVFSRKEEKIILAGIDQEDNPYEYEKEFFNLLLTNNNDLIAKLDYNLVLVSDNLTDQIILPFLGPINQNQEFYKKRINFDNKTALISQGLGTQKLPLRLGTNPETLIIVLEAENDQS